MLDGVYVTISKRIKTARLSAGLTQQEADDALHLTAAGYGAFERDINQISIDKVMQLAKLFGCSVPWLLGIPDELTSDERELLKLYREAEPRDRKMARIVLAR